MVTSFKSFYTMATTIKFKGYLEIFDKNLADLVRGKVNNKENEVLKNISWLTLFPIVDGNILCMFFSGQVKRSMYYRI